MFIVTQFKTGWRFEIYLVGFGPSSIGVVSTIFGKNTDDALISLHRRQSLYIVKSSWNISYKVSQKKNRWTNSRPRRI